MKTAAVRGPVRVDSESPFICSFVVGHKNEEVVAVLIGDLGRALHGTLRIHDIIEMEGRFINGDIIGEKQVYAISKINLPQDASTGRNLNAWG